MNEIANIIEQLKENYLTILVFLSIIPSMYAIFFSSSENDERGQKITSLAYQYSYFFCLAAILILFIVNRLVDLTFADFRAGVITIVLLVNFFLGITLFTLNRKY
ncbi:hypothetical protein [Pontibacillus litoralis]|uniref:Uncharacterized protein n=1 Tax=Pontibacillus litoralis JSM 072002 TaxID=1385512 RepID=A0A0A5HN68_9BACI|nr:hypothetical protein [Pontibacillus litoralis]KGX85047.1 hypothetical protein N784_11165 [Pontibacillus litoralis JSM 072002]